MIWQLKGQLTRHACASGQNTLSARAVVSQFAELTIVFFGETLQLMSGFFLKFVIIWLIGNRTSCGLILSVIYAWLTNRTPVSQPSDFVNRLYD